MVVVAAVIAERGRFLVTRRPAGVHLEGLWEFPGGKVDADETHARALQRELLEELGVQAEVGELVFHTSHTYPGRTIALYFYRCTLQGTPRPLLGQDMRWVPREELSMLGFPPADEELLALLTGSAAAQRPR